MIDYQKAAERAVAALELAARTREKQGLDTDKVTDPTVLAEVARVLARTPEAVAS